MVEEPNKQSNTQIRQGQCASLVVIVGSSAPDIRRSLQSDHTYPCLIELPGLVSECLPPLIQPSSAYLLLSTVTRWRRGSRWIADLRISSMDQETKQFRVKEGA